MLDRPRVDEDRARVQNWIGYQLLELGASSSELDPALLYELAIEGFQAAERCWPHWYIPLENRADVTSYLGELEHRSDRQRQAIELYDRALDLAQGRRMHAEGVADAGFGAQVRFDPAELARAYGNGQSPIGARDPEFDLAELVRANVRQIELSKGICMLLLGESEAASRELRRALGSEWDPATERNADLLYAAACFFSRAAAGEQLRELRPLEHAVRYLIHAFLIEPGLLESAVGDPDLAPIRAVVVALATLDWSAYRGYRQDAETIERWVVAALEQARESVTLT